jgi:hypothetical protein
MTVSEAKRQLNLMVRDAETCDYLSVAELDHMIYLTKVISKGDN